MKAQHFMPFVPHSRLLTTVLGGVLLASSASALAAPLQADAAGGAKADPSVGLALDEVKADYQVVDDGDYKLTIGFDDKRSQVVFVSSAVESLDKMRVREVWAIANLYVPGNEPADLAVALLKDAAGKILGGWQLRDFGDRTGLVYCMQLPADLSAIALRTAYEQTAVIADEKEKELTDGKDDY
jgi:hypothetical protein